MTDHQTTGDPSSPDANGRAYSSPSHVITEDSVSTERTPSHPQSHLFNAHHAPIGAFASFTLGYPGASGGLGLELGAPANQDVFIGLETATGDAYEALPFYEDRTDETRRFDVAGLGTPAPHQPLHRRAAQDIRRDFGLTIDSWIAGDLTFRIISPVTALPDPDDAAGDELAAAVLPAVFAEMTVDNRTSDRTRRAFFGYRGNDPYTAMRRLDDDLDAGMAGVGQGRVTGIVTDHPGTISAQGFSMEEILAEPRPENLSTGLGSVAALLITVPPGQQLTVRFAIVFHRSGTVTSGLDARYFYSRFFPGLPDVARFALTHADRLIAEAQQTGDRLQTAPLSEDRRFMLAHALRSYYGSTQLLEVDGEPLWVVNEGEYRMMNTLDLTVDHVFHEMAMNPWVVRNTLDLFVSRYAYRDDVKATGDIEARSGGISFTHDMGVANVFSRAGYSAYERAGISGCFSYMTAEQLVNWVLTAGAYIAGTQDWSWARRHQSVFADCLSSMLARDAVEADGRDGVMDMDSARAQGGAEITTYDSLDPSLGQARRNGYLAGKTWAAYLALEDILARLGDEHLAETAGTQAELAAATIVSHIHSDGTIPALLEPECEATVIPVVEGLVFPYMLGQPLNLSETGRFSALIAALRRHLRAVLIPGVCLFPDGGWKLSSTSDNSWLSKIYLCQFVAEHILQIDPDAGGAAADRAHRAWLLDPDNSYWAWSDQMVAGRAQGSRYYPRGATAALWLSAPRFADSPIPGPTEAQPDAFSRPGSN